VVIFFLKLGTGIGLSLAWMTGGMDDSSELTSIDDDPKLTKIDSEWFGLYPLVNILCQDRTDWIKNYSGDLFDLIFADTWPGKYFDLEETLAILKICRFYIIDDINSQPNWPEGHAEKANTLIEKLESLKGFTFTQLEWSTGVILMCKIS
jgi:predicted O-methyltransferase YrrM